MDVGDAISDYYCRPQPRAVVSYRQVGGGPFTKIGKWANPLWQSIKNKIVGASQGVAEAVTEAGGSAVKKFIKEAPKRGFKEAFEKSGEKFGKKMAGHKRSKLDEALGDDTF
jgi:hypothetical protein